MSDEPSFDLDAAGLRADGATLGTDVEVLARKLEDALPDATAVQRRGRRMFSKDKAVEGIVVQLGTVRYALTVDGRQVEAMRAQEVRGVVIKREPLELAAWCEALTTELAEQARTSAAARDALDRLLR
jgi:uncharacterized protein YhdP